MPALLESHQDAFAAVFGVRAGAGATDPVEHRRAVKLLCEIAWEEQDERMAHFIHACWLDCARQSVVVDVGKRPEGHHGLLHLWPQGRERWCSPWGQQVTFCCGESRRIRSRQRAHTRTWLHAAEGCMPGYELCPGCARWAEHVPELSIANYVPELGFPLERLLPAADLELLHERLFAALRCASALADLSAEALQGSGARTFAPRQSAFTMLGELFLDYGAARIEAQQERVFGQILPTTYMRAMRGELRLDARRWRAELAEVWEAHPYTSLGAPVGLSQDFAARVRRIAGMAG